MEFMKEMTLQQLMDFAGENACETYSINKVDG